MTRPFRIAHLSDLHLTSGEADERTEPKLFGRKLTGMNAAFRKVLGSRVVKSSNLVLVTGDVTDRGDLDAWKVFWGAVSDAGMADRTLVVPGNHDVCCLGARLPTAGKGYRERDLKKAAAGLRIGMLQHTRFPWVDHVENRVAVFGLNSNNLGNLTAATNAMGEIGYYQLSAFASKLHKFKDVPVKILMMHHSPNIPGAGVEVKRGLRPHNALSRMGFQVPEDQRHALQLLCVATRVRLVLHGHLHRAEVRRVSGIRIVGTPATTAPVRQKGGKPAYTFFTYTISGKTHRVRLRMQQVPV